MVRSARPMYRLFCMLRYCARERQRLTELVVRSKKERSFLAKTALCKNVPDGDHLLIGLQGAVPSCPEVHRCVFGETSLASLGVVEGLAYSTGMETVDEVERNVELAVDERRELDTTLGKKTRSETEKALSSLTHLPSRTMALRAST